MLEQTTPPAADDAPPILVVEPPPLVDAMPVEPVREPPRKKGRPRKNGPDPVSSASAPPPPFAGGPPDGARVVEAPNAVRALMADPEKAGKMLVGVVDSLLTMLAKTRYGHMIEPNSGKPLVEIMEVSSKEKDDLVDAVVLFMKASSMQMSPGLNLAVAFGATYGGRALALESTRKAMARAQAQA